MKITKKEQQTVINELNKGNSVHIERLGVISLKNGSLPNKMVVKRGAISFDPQIKDGVNTHKSKPKWNYETKLKMK
jgi:hypothetical protein